MHYCAWNRKKKVANQNKIFFSLAASCEVFVWNDSISFRLLSLLCGEQSQGYYPVIGCDSWLCCTAGICCVLGVFFNHLSICQVFLEEREEHKLILVGKGYRGRAWGTHSFPHSSHQAAVYCPCLTSTHSVLETQCLARSAEADLEFSNTASVVRQWVSCLTSDLTLWSTYLATPSIQPMWSQAVLWPEEGLFMRHACHTGQLFFLSFPSSSPGSTTVILPRGSSSFPSWWLKEFYDTLSMS